MRSSESDRGSFAVIYSDLNQLDKIPREAPADLEPDNIFLPAKITFEVFESAPSWNHFLLDRLGFTREDLLGEYADVYFSVDWNQFEHHQMLGYPALRPRSPTLR